MSKISLDEQLVRFSEVCGELKMSVDDETTRSLLRRVFASYSDIVQIAPSFDVQGLQVNGYRSLLRFWLKLFEVLLDNVHLSDTKSILNQLLAFILLQCDSLKKLRNASGDEDMKKITTEFALACTSKESFELRMRPMFIGLMFSDETKFLLSGFIKAVAMVEANTYTGKICSLFSIDIALKHFSRFCLRQDYRDFCRLFNTGDHWALKPLVRMYGLFNDWYANVESRTFSVDIGSKYKIVRDGHSVELVKNENVQETVRTLKCHLIRKRPKCERSARETIKNRVLVHLKGGAFFGPSAELYGQMYLKLIAERNPGLTILAFDYCDVASGPFPQAIQEFLDFYLWLTSGDSNVQKVIGFEPSSVLISGESSGGNIATALPIILNDIRLNWQDAVIKMPSHLINIFPRLSLRKELRPSLWLIPFEFLLNGGLLSAAASGYVPMVTTDNNGNLINYDNRANCGKWITDAELVDSPYLTPILYDKFEDLADISMTMIVFDFCPFVDEGLDLVRKWAGPVKLSHVDNMTHACISFSQISPEAKQVAYKIGNVISDALQFSN